MGRFGSFFQLRRRTDGGPQRLAACVEALEPRSLLSAAGLTSLVEFGPLTIDLGSYDSSQILLQLKPGASTDDLVGLGGTFRSTKGAADSGLYEVQLADGLTVEQALSVFKASDSVLYAEPDYRIYLADTFVPDDPLYPSLWGLDNFGQNGGTIDADIDAPEAWSVTTGSSSIIVAVIDTGIDYNHSDLFANMWVNEAEIAGNGMDDDANGYIDDIHGYDFVNEDSDPLDDHGHGTHVAGTIGAIGNNHLGVVGVSHQVQLMALKFLDGSGSGFTSDAIRALDYAVENGATISNHSWGGGGYSQSLFNAISDARSAGHIFVAAAGNDGLSTDFVPHYPSSYQLDNVISVAASNRNDQLASFSNFGSVTVDLAAPGLSILSTTPNNSYSYLSGTSMAAPHVTGVVALVRSQHPDWSYDEIINQVLSTVDPVSGLVGQTATGGRLNAAAAVAGPATDLSGPRILAANPPDSVTGPVGSVRLIFSEAIDADSFTAADISEFSGPSGPVAVSAVTAVAGSHDREFDVSFTEQVELGDYRLIITPTIADRAGNLIDQDGDGIAGELSQDLYSLTFTIADRTEYRSGRIDAPITDGNATQSSLVISDNYRIRDLNVYVDLTHTWLGDLRLSLISPTGHIVQLASFRGGNGDNYSGTIFDDEAHLNIASGTAPFSSYFRPEGALSVVDGASASGVWQLRIEDWYAGDEGTLHSWMLDLEPEEVNVAPVLDDVSFHVAENSAGGTVVGTLTASDANSGDTLGYSIVAGNLGGAFSIDSASGQIVVANSAALDFEVDPVIELAVRVADSGGLTDLATITVHVDDTNDRPTLADQSFSVDENRPSGALVGNLAAYDQDAGDSLNFSLVAGNNGSAFELNTATGTLTVNNPAALDFETTPVITLTVEVTDSGGLSDTATIVVSLDDVNDAPTLQDRSFQVDENSSPGTVIGTVVASDADLNDRLSFTLAAGNDGGTFAIDTATGRIRVADAALLDYETHPTFHLTVRATDSGGLDGTAAVTVNLRDINEPPVLGNIAAQSIPHTQDRLVLTLPGGDVDGDELVYSAEFITNGALAELAYQLDQQYGLRDYTDGHYWHDHFGRQEKWLEGNGREYYFITPDGGLYRWTGDIGTSPRLATLDPSYHADPSRLHDAPAPAPGSDVDGDRFVNSAGFVTSGALVELAYQLDQQYGLFDYTDGHYWHNYFGRQEKWLEGSGRQYYFITPDGGLYRWAGDIGSSPRLATLDPSYHADPSRLHDAAALISDSDLAGSTLSVSGNQLTIDPADGFLGTLIIAVSVSDGAATDSTVFTLSVTGNSPISPTAAGSAQLDRAENEGAVPKAAATGQSPSTSQAGLRQATIGTGSAWQTSVWIDGRTDASDSYRTDGGTDDRTARTVANARDHAINSTVSQEHAPRTSGDPSSTATLDRSSTPGLDDARQLDRIFAEVDRDLDSTERPAGMGDDSLNHGLFGRLDKLTVELEPL